MTAKGKGIALGTIVTIVTIPLLVYVFNSVAAEVESKADKEDVTRVEAEVDTKASKESVEQTVEAVKETVELYKESLDETRQRFDEYQERQRAEQAENNQKFYILLEQIEKNRGAE